MKKISFWGSLASILGLVVAFTATEATSINQNTNGNQNNVIGENNGTININQGGSSQSDHESYVLKNPKYGSVLVVSEPNLMAATDSNKHVCMAISGASVTLSGEKSAHAGVDMWRKVKIENGECAGKSGWAAIENISYE
ncbi:hypothetical protein ACFOEK_20715 [Litoribrevibacter euphylliae]|uniref:SH3 domain-containing protein n=1 Tax=Litoribrevibacter euphylliae TaxID=1834034 RepID=A0ABV7HPS6_9GAMM